MLQSKTEMSVNFASSTSILRLITCDYQQLHRKIALEGIWDLERRCNGLKIGRETRILVSQNFGLKLWSQTYPKKPHPITQSLGSFTLWELMFA